MDKEKFKEAVGEALEDTKSFIDNRVRMQETIVMLFEEKGISPMVMYEILLDLLDRLEKVTPELKIFKHLYEEHRPKSQDQLADELSKVINKAAMEEGASYWICSKIPDKTKGVKKAKCHFCKDTLYYSKKQEQYSTKKTKKICYDCMKKNIKGDIPEMQKTVLDAHDELEKRYGGKDNISKT